VMWANLVNVAVGVISLRRHRFEMPAAAAE
jgi:hypothetical protein